MAMNRNLGESDFMIIAYGVQGPWALKQRNPATNSWDEMLYHDDWTYIQDWLRSMNINPHKVVQREAYPTPRESGRMPYGYEW